MAGFSRIYLIGGVGGFQGGDGINPIEMQLWVGDAGRQWVEPHYVNPSLKPLGNVRTLIPRGPDDPNLLIDACIAFYPAHFGDCFSINKVREEVGVRARLDFDLEGQSIPSWPVLREEARAYFETLNIFKADLQHLSLGCRS